jgi:hypothetical protein
MNPASRSSLTALLPPFHSLIDAARIVVSSKMNCRVLTGLRRSGFSRCDGNPGAWQLQPQAALPGGRTRAQAVRAAPNQAFIQDKYRLRPLGNARGWRYF